MPLTEAERIQTLENQMAQMITRAQAHALFDSMLNRIADLEAASTASSAILDAMKLDLQAAKDQLVDHENRITDLEP